MYCPRLRGLIRHARGDLVLPDGRPAAGCVARRHRVESRVAARVVLLGVEEEDHERLVRAVVEHDDLRRGDVVRPAALLHLAVHLVHPFLADAFEFDNARVRHDQLLPDVAEVRADARQLTTLDADATLPRGYARRT